MAINSSQASEQQTPPPAPAPAPPMPTGHPPPTKLDKQPSKQPRYPKPLNQPRASKQPKLEKQTPQNPSKAPRLPPRLHPMHLRSRSLLKPAAETVSMEAMDAVSKVMPMDLIGNQTVLPWLADKTYLTQQYLEPWDGLREQRQLLLLEQRRQEEFLKLQQQQKEQESGYRDWTAEDEQELQRLIELMMEDLDG